MSRRHNVAITLMLCHSTNTANTTTDSVRVVPFSEKKGELSLFPIVLEADERDSGNWKLAGGKFNSTHEWPNAAARRELAEELGIRVVALFNAGELKNDDGHSALYTFTGLIDPEDVEQTGEIAEVRWVSEAGVPKCPNQKRILTAVAAARAAITSPEVHAELALSA